MSNGRAGIASKQYRMQYLKSKSWHARRSRWFEQNPDQHQCCVCLRREERAVRRLELHHITYRGVTQLLNGKWVANERDDELLPMHALCHQLVHQLMDDDGALRYMRSRKEATLQAVAKVRARLRTLIGAR